MKTQIKRISYIVMSISLIVCAMVGVGRIQVEQQQKNVQIAIRYSDVLSIAGQTEVPIEEVLAYYKNLGVTTLFARENTVSGANNDFYSYKGQGKANLIEGYILKYYYPEVEDIKLEYNYIVTSDEDVASRIFNNFTVKGIHANAFIGTEYDTGKETYFIEVGDFASALTTVGVGFNLEDFQVAADLGYTISPQIKNWSNVEPEAVDYLIETLNEIPNLGPIYFADMQVPGASSETLQAYMMAHELGFIEFTSGNQKGFGLLAKQASDSGKDFKVVRLHTLTDQQLRTYRIAELLDRYELALRERNNSVFLFKMPNTVNVEDDMAYLDESITRFVTYLNEEGYNLVGDMTPTYNLPQIKPIFAVLAGVGAISMFCLLMMELGMANLGMIASLLGFVLYVLLLKRNVGLGSQLMALFGTIVFPTYAMITNIRETPRNMKETILTLLKICAISYGGVLTIVGTLSRTSFGLGIDLFAGVKLAHIIPIAMVIIFLVYKEHGLDFKFYKGLLERKISYGALVIIGIIGLALYVYTSRTGNTGSASTLELQFRQLLTNVLGVRPRTKEFLIGYPILMCLLFYGYKEIYLPLIIFAAMGPISLVNTYAHIHTPILIGMQRSVYGIVIGIVIGFIAIKIIQVIIKGIKKWQLQTK